MTKEAIIEKTLKTLNVLPNERAEEIADFADFVMRKYENQLLVQDIQKLTLEGKAFEFLNEEEDLYSLKDIRKNLDA